MQILIIDDSRAFSEELQRSITQNGHEVTEAQRVTGDSIAILAATADVVLMSATAPAQTESAAVVALRESNAGIPILIGTPDPSPSLIIQLLDAGADDVMATPINALVLMARIRAASRRNQSGRASVLNVVDLSIDRLAHTVTHAGSGKPLTLTARQYSLLDYLAMNVDRLVRRSELLDEVWKLESDPGSNVVDVHVAQLRKRLLNAGSAADIQTIRGAGYMLSSKPLASVSAV